jgi:deoxyribonuclease-4
MWRSSVLDKVQVRRLQLVREQHGIYPLVIHVSYLINLASCDPVIHAKSIDAFRGELDRAAAIGAEFVVVHPGSYRGASPEEGIATFVDGLTKAAAGFTPRSVTVLLENTTGAGCHLGSRFQELRDMRDLAARTADLPIGYCLDTCHLFAAGLPLAPATLRHADEALGLANVFLIHANDSKGAFGSRLDRHARIGEGLIGAEVFRRFIAHPKFRGKTFISETPADAPGDDQRNLDTLKSLARRRVRAQTPL